MKIKTGDWFVTKERWRIEAQEAIKVTSKLVFYQNEYFKRPFRVRLDDVIFVGSQAAAQRLAQQLTSSMTQLHDEEREARERRKVRDLELIKTATEGQ